MTDLVPVKRALISLSDKNDLDRLAQGLASRGVELVSTGGTAAKLRELGHQVRDISDLTGFPEMMDGRVKTLHPKVHGGLLGVRDNPEHKAAMDNLGAGLKQAGLGWGDVSKCTVFLADMKDWPAFNQVYVTYFPDKKFPARSAFGANGLAMGAQLEVECIAYSGKE